MTRIRPTLLVAVVSFLAGAAALRAVQQAQAATRREPQFENEHLKVWKSVILPGAPLALHRHDHGRALIALTDGVLKVVDERNVTLDTYDWKRGRAYWLGADPPGKQHADVNASGAPIEVIVVELKNDR